MRKLSQADLDLISWTHDAIDSRQAIELRERSRLTQGTIAASLGITASAISHWEARRRRPDAKRALAYGRVLAHLHDRHPIGPGPGAPAA